jgi:chemotaxis signal transduction protein
MNWFKNRNTATKLIPAFACMAVLVGIVGYQGIRGMGTIDDLLETMYEKQALGIDDIREVRVQMMEMTRMVRNPLTDGVFKGQKVLEGRNTTPGGEQRQVLGLTTEQMVMGLIADAVSDVLNIPKTDIEPTRDFGAQVDARLSDGMAEPGDKLVVLLDIDRGVGGVDTCALTGANSGERP